MDEIESILNRSPGLTSLGLRVAVGAQAFRESDVAAMLREGRLRSEPGGRDDIMRYYLAPRPPMDAPSPRP